ncbi:hypothetical protein [Clostridium sp. DJ247]|uniref:hypothetical protein n=1 Tax=Clostridium sp. DJ247 TaxID=2726188 RepID=UPI00162731BE|nr:hypothetical protein [Clostridium sp. DJ247]MBC2580573.1 hypothetical protein [Clostridium sp. DJ247]
MLYIYFSEDKNNKTLTERLDSIELATANDSKSLNTLVDTIDVLKKNLVRPSS